MDRGAWRAAVHGVMKNQTRLNDQRYYDHLEISSLIPFLGLFICIVRLVLFGFDF